MKYDKIKKTFELFGENESPILIANIDTGEIRSNCGDSSYDFTIDIETLQDFVFKVSNIYQIFNLDIEKGENDSVNR